MRAAANFAITPPGFPKAWSCSTRCTTSRRTGQRPGLPLELQSGKMRLLLRRSQRHAQADVHDAFERSSARSAGHDRADEAFPSVKDLITDVSWNFAVKKRIKAFKPRPPDARRRNVADGAGGHRPGAGIPKMHRVFSLPGRLSRSARPSQARSVHWTEISCLHPPRSRCTRSTPRIGPRSCARRRGSAIATSQVLHQGLPEDIQITDNAIIPLKERVVDEYYDPLGWVWKRLRRKS